MQQGSGRGALLDSGGEHGNSGKFTWWICAQLKTASTAQAHTFSKVLDIVTLYCKYTKAFYIANILRHDIVTLYCKYSKALSKICYLSHLKRPGLLLVHETLLLVQSHASTFSSRRLKHDFHSMDMSDEADPAVTNRGNRGIC